MHRAVFLTGVMSYLSAPLWFMFLALSTALQVVHALTEPQYFLQPRQLFPVWPQWRPELAIALFASTMVLLFLPKLLSIILVWCKGSKEYGGFIRVTLSLLLEVLSRYCWRRCACCSTPCLWSARSSVGKWCGTLHSVMMTPPHGVKPLCAMVRSCCWGWCGRSVWRGWICVSCSGWRRLSSLILSPFVSVISSRATVGLRTKRWKLFLIPEEYSPPQVLKDTDAYLTLNRQRSLDDGFMHAVFNPSFNALATAMATARHRHGQILDIARERHVEQALNETPDKLNRDRRLVLLSDPVTLSRLHYRVGRAGEILFVGERLSAGDAQPAGVENEISGM